MQQIQAQGFRADVTRPFPHETVGSCHKTTNGMKTRFWINQNFICNVKVVKKQSKPNWYDFEHENETVIRQPRSCVLLVHFLSGFLELKIGDYNLVCLAYAETWCKDKCWNSLIDVVKYMWVVPVKTKPYVLVTWLKFNLCWGL